MDHTDIEYSSEGVFKLPEGFDPTRCSNYRFKLGEKVHVWAIGMIIYELMSLTDAEDYWNETAKSLDDFVQNLNKQIRDFDKIPFKKAADQVSPYSAALTDLVRMCLVPAQSMRMDVSQLRTRTRQGMQRHDNKWTDGCEDVDTESTSTLR